MNHHSIVAVFSSSLDAAALAMLGPGAYSLDARRFGRRVIHFPPEETSNRRVRFYRRADSPNHLRDQ